MLVPPLVEGLIHPKEEGRNNEPMIRQPLMARRRLLSRSYQQLRSRTAAPPRVPPPGRPTPALLTAEISWANGGTGPDRGFNRHKNPLSRVRGMYIHALHLQWSVQRGQRTNGAYGC